MVLKFSHARRWVPKYVPISSYLEKHLFMNDIVGGYVHETRL